ncbi:MAG TPA: hypothetical protein VN953_05020, partial [Gemmatimonadales bacterium]|nr:hypothetical protein [Gemmatimonadales bacterium]
FLAPLLLQSSGVVQPLSVAPRRRTIAGRAATYAPGIVAVEGVLFRWNPDMGMSEFFSFSLHNRLQEPVTNVVCLIVFYDSRGTPIDLTWNACAHYESGLGSVRGTGDTIPPGLSRRYTASISESVRDLASRVEIRVLDFSIVH